MRSVTVIYSVLVFMLVLAGCGPDKQIVRQTPPPGNSLQSICEAREIPWQWDSISQVFTFTSKNVPSKVLVGSSLVLAGTKEIILSGPVQRKENTLIVPPDFIVKVFGQPAEGTQTVVFLPPSVTGKYREIMIDAGHGGKDPGAAGLSGTVEKDIVFDIAKRLKVHLEQMGFHVKMTREGDEFISLQERAQMATRSKADLFVSIHANASKSRKTKGLEIYYSRTHAQEKDLTEHESNEETLFRRLNISGEKAVPQQIVADMMYAKKLQESSAFADFLIKKSAHNLSAPNRGSRTCGFFVVKNTLIPAVLFEVGYITNSTEAKLLKSEEYRQKIAETIAESIKEYSHES
jgi:N-acetylmuramoyl-L-alanine amidase